MRHRSQGRFLEELDFKGEGGFGNALAETTGARTRVGGGLREKQFSYATALLKLQLDYLSTAIDGAPAKSRN